MKYITFGHYIVSPFGHVHTVVKVTVGLVICVCACVRARVWVWGGTIHLPQDGFSWNFILVVKSVKKTQVQLKPAKCNVQCALYMHTCTCTFLLNSFWVEKYFTENQNSLLILYRFFPETVAFIELLQEIQQSKRGQRNSCLPVDFVMLHHYFLRSTVYICTVKSQHSIQIWTHSLLCFSVGCDSSVCGFVQGELLVAEQTALPPVNCPVMSNFFTNIRWPYVSSGSVDYPSVTSITVSYETYF